LMLANRPPLALSQVQTLGGVYSDALLKMLDAPGDRHACAIAGAYMAGPDGATEGVGAASRLAAAIGVRADGVRARVRSRFGKGPGGTLAAAKN
jgi:hypothetical protein